MSIRLVPWLLLLLLPLLLLFLEFLNLLLALLLQFVAHLGTALQQTDKDQKKGSVATHR